MKTPKYDVTIYAPASGPARMESHTSAGNKFIKEVSRSMWEPSQVMANVPPSICLGVKTSARKKFVLIPPHSLH